RLHVGDGLAGRGGVAGGGAVVVDLRAGDAPPVRGGERVVPQVAGEADLDLVLQVEQPGAPLLGRAVPRGAVGVARQARAEALDPRVLVERPAAAHRVAQP